MSDTSSWGDFTSGAGDFFSAINPVNWFGSGDTSTPSSAPPLADFGGSTPVPDNSGSTTSSSFGWSTPIPSFGGSTPVTGSSGSSLNFGSPASGSLPTTSAFDFSSPSATSASAGGTTTVPGATDPSTVSLGSNAYSQGNSGKTGSTGGILSALGISNQDLFKGALAGGGLIYNALNSGGGGSAESALKNQAASQNAQGQQLESYIQNGTLPPGAQQWVDQQTAAQKAAIRSQYANMGLSGSDMETAALNNVDAQATSQMFAIANSLLQTGIQETGASSQLYQALIGNQNQDQQQVSSAIQNFITSIAGGGGSAGTLSLKVT